MYLPQSRLEKSPYSDLASPSLHHDLEPLFAKEFCTNLGMSRQVPLRVVGDIGGGGALARIEKGRKVMRERKSEWSQADELPVSFIYSLLLLLPHSILRSKYLYLRRTGTIRYLRVLSRRSNPPNRTRQ
jgi:hypothetical protein